MARTVGQSFVDQRLDVYDSANEIRILSGLITNCVEIIFKSHAGHLVTSVVGLGQFGKARQPNECLVILLLKHFISTVETAISFLEVGVQISRKTEHMDHLVNDHFKVVLKLKWVVYIEVLVEDVKNVDMQLSKSWSRGH
jgi:hypothetical protein